MKKQTKPTGVIFFQGNSQIDGSPIVGILTGLNSGSGNTKTGSMLQTWIIRADISPMDAVRSGSDSAICGNCPHRWHLAKTNGAARCYVNVGQAPTSIFKAFKAGRYPSVDLVDLGHLVKGQKVRFGSYGDPYAIPAMYWEAMLYNCSGHTGYTHQWANKGAEEYRSFLMASVDSGFENNVAKIAGWRTFFVTIGEEDTNGSILCPASKQGGNKTTCNNCLLCGGAEKKAKSVFIPDHGTGWQSRLKAKQVVN